MVQRRVLSQAQIEEESDRDSDIDNGTSNSDAGSSYSSRSPSVDSQTIEREAEARAERRRAAESAQGAGRAGKAAADGAVAAENHALPPGYKRKRGSPLVTADDSTLSGKELWIIRLPSDLRPQDVVQRLSCRITRDKHGAHVEGEMTGVSGAPAYTSPSYHLEPACEENGGAELSSLTLLLPDGGAADPALVPCHRPIKRLVLVRSLGDETTGERGSEHTVACTPVRQPESLLRCVYRPYGAVRVS